MSTDPRFFKNIGKAFKTNKYKILLMLSILFSTIYFGILYYQSNVNTVYSVFVDGSEIGIVDTKSIIDHWQSEYLWKMKLKYNDIDLEIKNNIKLIEDKRYKVDINNYKTIRNLSNLIEIQANGISVVVDGRLIGTVNDQSTANKIINEIEQDYIPEYGKGKIVAAAFDEYEQENIEFLSVQIKENISFIPAMVAPEKIIKGKEIKELLVENDSKPLVTVETYEKLVKISRIPYSVLYQFDNSLYINEAITLSEGINGKIKVEYLLKRENGVLVKQDIISSNLIEKPKDKVIMQGTKEIPDIGTGNLIWPASEGVITSVFGTRWGVFHDGIDIAEAKDLNIVAADHGTIKFAGWKTGYGLTVVIDHGNGIETLYAHLDSFNVEEGDKIAQGQKLGKMGSTGRSTGTHLHFEVMINGELNDPLIYLHLN